MDCIQVLPDVKGLEGKTYGIINVSVANLRAAPDFFFGNDDAGINGDARTCVAARRLDSHSDSR